MAMADNYLENRYEDYHARKQKKEAERKAKFRRQLEEYKKKIGYKEFLSQRNIKKINESLNVKVVAAGRSELTAIAVEKDVVRL